MPKKIPIMVVLSIFAFGCTGDGERVVRDLTENEHKLVAGSNVFGFGLMKEVVAQSDGGNVFISPLSVSCALGMTYNGARGSTEEGMRLALEYGDLTTGEINQSYRDLIDLLTGLDPKVSMEIANSVWVREGFEVLQAFIDLNQTYFDAVVENLDFDDPSAADTMNAWVADKTHDKIDSIVEPPIDPLTVMFLINAIYFKGTWTYRFDPADTQPDTFHGPAGDETVQLMHLQGDLPCYATETFLAVDLPYGDEMFSMTVILPKSGVDIDALVAELDSDSWADWLAGFAVREADVFLPRFELEFGSSLNDVLSALGMGAAFSAGADFTGINPAGELYISNVKHKTYVKVDEEGTEAAAVTSVEVSNLSISNSFTLRADRPFLFIIHDAHSKALLFMGKMVDPPSE
ncbi:MAG: serpin family protein [Deltaproteobacteria bacterium]|nr:serpin family protein [Deltaproteobacteria bacterium]